MSPRLALLTGLVIAAHFPTAFWQESNARRSRLLDHAFEIFGEAHKAVLQSTEAQVQIVDEAIFAYIRRAAKSSPLEAEQILYDINLDGILE